MQASLTSLKRLTLREFYEGYFEPLFLIEAARATRGAYRETLNRWAGQTADPPLGQIDGVTLATFKRVMLEGTSKRRALARATVNKHLRHIGALLAKAGPAGERNRDALGIMGSTAWTKPLREYRRLPREVADDLLTQLYAGTSTATYPLAMGVCPGHWWRALIVTALTVGFRRGALLQLRWTQIDWQAREIRVPAEADKCKAERIKPVSALVVKHLLRIRTRRELVFPWPHSPRTFYRQWHMMQDAGGIERANHITLHDLKRACGTRFAQISSAWVVQRRLDHASIQTSQSYINASAEEREAVERQPLPSCFGEEFDGQAGELG